MRTSVTFACVGSFLLASCQSSRITAVPLEVPPVPAALLAPCDPVVAVPDRDLSANELSRLWGKDRSALGNCAARHDALAIAVTSIEGLGK